MKINNIIVDWHGVLDRRTFRGLKELIASRKGLRLEEVEVRIKDLAHSWVTGEISPEFFWKHLAIRFGLRWQLLAYLKNYILSIDLNFEVVALLQRLKDSGYKIFLLSDCPEDKKEVILKSDFAEELFEDMFFSFDSKMSKENPDFFMELITECHLLPNECLYIDDNGKNIQTAKFLFMKTHLFTGDDMGIMRALKNLEQVPD